MTMTSRFVERVINGPQELPFDGYKAVAVVYGGGGVVADDRDHACRMTADVR